MTLEIIPNPGSDVCVNSEESIMYWEGSITEKRDRIQVHLEDKSVVSSAMISSTETKVIDNTIEEN